MAVLDAAVLDATVLNGTILDVVNTPYEGDFGCFLEVMNVGCCGFGCCVNWMLRSWMLQYTLIVYISMYLQFKDEHLKNTTKILIASSVAT